MFFFKKKKKQGGGERGEGKKNTIHILLHASGWKKKGGVKGEGGSGFNNGNHLCTKKQQKR